MLHGLTEADLARRCRNGDPPAWRELVRRFTPLVYRLAHRMLRDGHEAKDVTQEVFMRMHRSFSSYDPTRPMTPWVARTTYHACLRRLEVVSRLPESTEDEVLVRVRDDHAQSPEDVAQSREAQAFLAEALQDLSAQDRALLDLRYREGLSDSEVSEATGMPVNTVKTRIFRARARLREWLTPRLAGEAS